MCLVKLIYLSGILFISGYVSSSIHACVTIALPNAYAPLYTHSGLSLRLLECHIIAYLRYYFFLNYTVIKWILQKNLENGTEIIPGNEVVKILNGICKWTALLRAKL